MPPTASFKILQSFNLSTGGVTAVGICIEGSIRLGDTSTIDINGQSAKVRVTRLGQGRPDEEGVMKWGLTLQFENKDLEQIALKERIKEQIIQLTRTPLA